MEASFRGIDDIINDVDDCEDDVCCPNCPEHCADIIAEMRPLEQLLFALFATDSASGKIDRSHGDVVSHKLKYQDLF